MQEIVNIKTFILGFITIITGITGFTLGNVDLVINILFKTAGLISTILIIVINWDSFLTKINIKKIKEKKIKIYTMNNKLKTIVVNTIDNFKIPLIISSVLTILILICSEEIKLNLLLIILGIVDGVWVACIIQILIKYFKK